MIHEDFEYVRYNDIGIALIRRAASTSIKRTINTPGLHKPDVPIICFIRDPIDRVHSGFKYLPGKIHKFREYLTYEEHIDRILTGEPERHWTPQAEILKGVENLTIYRFEDLKKIWEELELPELQTHNVSPNVEIPDKTYRLNELMAFYAEDYKLRYG